MQTRAYAAPKSQAPLGPFSFDRREPRDHDVAIDIKFCGICHSDIHQVRDEWFPGSYPMVPGHEIAGVVTRVGSKVTKFKPGDQVGVGCMVDSCGKCTSCTRDLEQYCLEGMTLTYNGLERDGKTPTYGGYSERIVVDENYVLRIPSSLRLDAAAPLLCAGITLYSPLKHWGAGPGKKVAIVGMGGLGHIGVKIAHALGADVTVLSQSLAKEKDGKRFGASGYYATSDPKTFDKLKSSFDLIVNTVSSHIDWNQYVNLLKLDGTMVVVGAPKRPAEVNAFPLLVERRSIAGSSIGGIKETQEMLDFCAQHNTPCDIETIPIQKVNEAYERVMMSDVRYRFVIDLASLKNA